MIQPMRIPCRTLQFDDRLWHLADMPRVALHMSAFDPKRTFGQAGAIITSTVQVRLENIGIATDQLNLSD